MRYSVPQFTDVEDKIVGPLTLKQAIYVTGGVGACVIMFLSYGFFWAVLIGGPILGFTALLAFFKINNQPFINVVFSALMYSIKNKLYLWKRVPKAPAQTKPVANILKTPASNAPVTQSRLKELAWSLDTRDTLTTKKQ